MMNEEILAESVGKAVLAGVRTTGESEFEASMKELRGLAEACGYAAETMVTQRLERPDAATYIGSGKVQEIKQELYITGADTVIFMNTLTPSQLSNLAHELETEVLDKTGLILQIFGERARSAEAKLQVEYAKLQYMLPRLSGLRQNLSRQGGTGGSMSNKGSGEKQIELDRRHIEKRMAELRRALKDVESGREVMRRKRRASGLPLAALVGYTNAGKSTLLNRMLDTYCPDEEKKVMERDMLFATLDTTVRRICVGNGRDFLLSDTVGFIHDLPHDLIEAFHSTLEEAKLADLLIQVVDSSDENWERHIETTEKTLAALGAGHIPMLYVMNKADRGPHPELVPFAVGSKLYMSAKNGTGVELLTEHITDMLFGKRIECELLIPYGDGAVENRLRREAEVVTAEYRPEGIYMKCKLEKRLQEELRGYRMIS
ncbi:MAG: GTPase HflX [Eubacteriales bacterium]|nr:GTPase HflX [Eubacteriales bacterium]